MTAPKKSVCKNLIRKSQLIKDHTGGGNTYTDSYYFCTKLQRRITKKHCKNCSLYEIMK